MSWDLFATVFGIIFVAELPDKTALAAVVLATRHAAMPVFLGTALALTVQSMVAVAAGTIAPGGVWTEFAMGEGRGRSPDDADLAGMMRAQEVADAVLHAVTRPRTHRVLESTILPMSDDSMN